jgi:formiminotetrahydrofolate cyclodeaminase
MRPSEHMDANLAAFLKVLDPEDNSTGGGTASAVAGAMAASLVAMVARLSIGKEDMEPEGFYRSIVQEAGGLAGDLFEGARRDSEAFEAVLQALRLPRGNEEEKAARTRAIQAGYAHATEVPLRNAEMSVRAYQLAGELEGHSNPRAASDLICARHLARAGALGCLANVVINLPSIKGPDRATQYSSRAEALAAVVQG